MSELSRMNHFEYVNEDSIDIELKCTICMEPFINPGTRWFCNHTFCQKCIEDSAGNYIKLCPLCRDHNVLPQFQKATRNLINMLNRTLMRCKYCNKMNIQRGDINEHIDRLCPKFIVSCPAGDNQCIWTGPRDEFKDHLSQCTAELIVSFFKQIETLRNEINQLEQKKNVVKTQCQRFVSSNVLELREHSLNRLYQYLENDNQQLQLQLSKLNQENELLKEKMSSIKLIKEPLPLTSTFYPNNISPNRKWSQCGRIVAGTDISGSLSFSLCNPYGFYIDDDRTIYIADSSNNRIMKWNYGASRGQLVAGGNGNGNRSNQLNCPTDVIVDKKQNCLLIADYKNRRVLQWPLRSNAIGETIISNIDCHGLAIDDRGFLYVSDYQRNVVKRYRRDGSQEIIVAGGNGKGDRLDQLDGPIFIAIGRDYSVYISDNNNNRVIMWKEGSKEGIIVAGGKIEGYCLQQLLEPGKIVVDSRNNIYVPDWKTYRVMCWRQGQTQANVIIGHQNDIKQSLNHPISLAFDRHGHLYVASQWNHNIRMFELTQ